MDKELLERISKRDEALERLKTWIIRQVRLRRDPDEIDPDTPLFGSGLGLDSVDAVELVIGLETEFGVRFPSEEPARAAMRTVNSLLDYVLEMKEGSDG